MPTEPYLALAQALTSKRRVLVATHSRPDGDAIGTAVAMVLGMRQKGIESRLLLFESPPPKYSFLLSENQVDWFSVAKAWPAASTLDGFDGLLVVDTGTWSQLPGLNEFVANWKAPKMVLDHHLTQEDWADVKLVVTAAAAAGEIAAVLMRLWKVPFTKPIAGALFLAIATDTGWFQFANTTPATMRLAADLLDAGVDADRIYRAAWQNERPQRLAITTRALESLEYLAGGRVAIMSLAKSDFANVGADFGDTDNLINLPLQVAEVEAVALLSEPADDGPIRISLRSKGAVNVAELAANFPGASGGGHARAAGLKVKRPLADARSAVGAALAAAVNGAQTSAHPPVAPARAESAPSAPVTPPGP
jgi:phosphoesterase RecJ-like protein